MRRRRCSSSAASLRLTEPSADRAKPQTFNFLGFTHISGSDRRGKWLLRRITRRDRMVAALKRIKADLRRRWHQSIPEQGRWLRSVVQGYMAYHAVPGNYPSMKAFREHVTDLWRRALKPRPGDKTTWRIRYHLLRSTTRST